MLLGRFKRMVPYPWLESCLRWRLLGCIETNTTSALLGGSTWLYTWAMVAYRHLRCSLVCGVRGTHRPTIHAKLRDCLQKSSAHIRHAFLLGWMASCGGSAAIDNCKREIEVFLVTRHMQHILHFTCVRKKKKNSLSQSVYRELLAPDISHGLRHTSCS